MAKEILAVPEQHLADVIRVIRSGIRYEDAESSDPPIHNTARELLENWCNDQEDYLRELKGEGQP